MSRRALLLATRDLLAERFDWKPPAQIEVMHDGAPPPICGDLFVSVHRQSRRSSDRNSLDVSTGALVTVTRKVSVPYDRLGRSLLEKAKTGLDALTERMFRFLHMNYDLLQRANALWLEEWKNEPVVLYGYTEPLSFEGDDGDPRIVGADWFQADQGKVALGVAQELRFGGARYVAPLDTLRPTPLDGVFK